MNGQVQLSLKKLQLLPDSGATDAQGCAQVLPGMEPAILEELQQLQHANLDSQ
ncbi:hypothetical protein D3C85_1606960 [compost metagenome]